MSFFRYLITRYSLPGRVSLYVLPDMTAWSIISEASLGHVELSSHVSANIPSSQTASSNPQGGSLVCKFALL